MMYLDVQEIEMSRFNEPVKIEMVDQPSGKRQNWIYEEGEYLLTEPFINWESEELLNAFRDIYVDATWQSIEVALPKYFTKNFQILEAGFENELKKYPNYLIHDAEYTKMVFENIAIIVSEFPFTHSAIEFTKKNGFKITLAFPKNKLLMISKSLRGDKLEGMDDQVTYSLFYNKQLIDSDALKLGESKEGFKEYLSL